MWKEHGLVREEDGVLSGVLTMVLGMEGLTRPHLRCPSPRTCRGAPPSCSASPGIQAPAAGTARGALLASGRQVAVPFLPGLLHPLRPNAHTLFPLPHAHSHTQPFCPYLPWAAPSKAMWASSAQGHEVGLRSSAV